MGLTVNCELSSDIESSEETRELLESLRTKALTLTFEHLEADQMNSRDQEED